MAEAKLRARIPAAPIVTGEARNDFHRIDIFTVALVLRRQDGALAGYALIDAADLGVVGSFRWSLHSNGYAQTAYVKARPWGNRMHRLLAAPTGSALFTDHINKDRLDNRRRNLRLVTPAQNAENTSAQSGASSRHRGVSRWGGRWVANVRGRYLGGFATEREAAEAARVRRAAVMPYSTD